jgi:hypothetical protein
MANRKFIIYFGIILLASAFALNSCKKEMSCEDCKENNKPPISIAGPDQLLTLPADSVLLDGSSSSDPDGSISVWLWTKISGPASFYVVKPSDSITLIKNLTIGTYQFELKVTDNKGLFAKDTMQVIVNDPSQYNRQPIANAGPDQTITLPANQISVNGSTSTDPDNNIAAYAWTIISGPSSFSITNSNAVQTQVTNLVQGIYQFELKVTDTYGLFSKDTMKVTVNASIIITDCNGNVRPQVNAQLIPLGMLSIPRYGVAVASIGTKIFFAGGFTVYGYTPTSNVSTVDIYDVVTNLWSTAELSQARSTITTVVLGSKIFFAGGSANTSTGFSSRVDIYDVISNAWSTTELSSGAIHLTAGATGNKVLFGGGFREYGTSRRVDIYNVSTGTWIIDSLTNRVEEAVYGIGATVIGNKIYFAGAAQWAWDFGENSSTINIYDAATGNWSLSSLSVERGLMASIAVGDKNYWAGGDGYPESAAPTDLVEIKDMNTGNSEFSCLFQANAMLSAVQRNNDIIFFTGNWGGLIQDKFDIYHLLSRTWSVGVLPVAVEGSSIVAMNNNVYVWGGKINGTYSYQLWKLEF